MYFARENRYRKVKKKIIVGTLYVQGFKNNFITKNKLLAYTPGQLYNS